MTNNTMDDYQKFIAISRYARWIDEEGRRETFPETVSRYIDNVVTPKINHMENHETYSDELKEAIINLDVMPSMRAMMTAGKALDRDNTCAYNCSYMPIESPRAFDEAMFILLCGTGVGFSVERQFISKLPPVPSIIQNVGAFWVVEDSKEGWAEALRVKLEHLYNGYQCNMITEKVRRAGERLKTFGGRASGPEPLIELFDFIDMIFEKAKGRALTSLECHDIMCKIGEVVVVGGVRRSAMISLSNLSDDRMRHAKSGNWFDHDKQRTLANNSICYTEKPDMETFLREWTALIESKSGERGIFNRQASLKQAERNQRRITKYVTTDVDGNEVHVMIPFGTNPCSEIILRPYQFCNLAEVVARENDTKKDLMRKIYLATVLGTIQATYTFFPYLRDIWRRNTEEEALLGVSITGIQDCKWLMEASVEDLDELRTYAVGVNILWAEVLGINVSAAITCVKPSGTVSQLTDTASGIHTRYAKYYIRTVRGDNKDPLTQFMIETGIPNEPCYAKPKSTTVFSFPVKAPEGARTRHDSTAIDELNMWMKFQKGWCEHKPSVTINVREDEWLEVGAYVYKNFDDISGISFLPYDNGSYKQAPYQEIGKEEYEELKSRMPKSIDWTKLSDYELDDSTSSSQTLACSSGACEIVDLT